MFLLDVHKSLLKGKNSLLRSETEREKNCWTTSIEYVQCEEWDVCWVSIERDNELWMHDVITENI